MDETTRTRFREIADTADELIGRVDEALVPDAPHSFMVETRSKVDAIGAELLKMLAGLSPAARSQMERTVGRKVTDLQRAASRLPVLAVGSPARTASNTDFVENRPAPPPRPPAPRSTAPRSAPPRSAAPRKTTRPKRAIGGAPSALSTAQILASIQNAVLVKPYSMEERYEQGDVIEHATFGRGRVERLQPRAMQVQFAIGMKQLRTG